MLWKTILGLCALTAGICVTLAVSINTSLWFLWHLNQTTISDPQESTAIAINRTYTGSDLIETILFSTQLESIKPYLHTARRYAFTRDSRGSQVALIPNNVWSLKQSREIIDALSRDGWHVRRIGLALYATTESPVEVYAASNILTAAQQSTKAFINRSTPHKPTLIATQNTAGNPKAYLVAAERNRKNVVQGAVAPSLSEIDIHKAADIPIETEMKNLTIALPSNKIADVPEDLRDQIQEKLNERMGFNRTSPSPFLPDQNISALAISLSENDFSLTYKGDTAMLGNMIHDWLKAEERFSRPQQQAFRLPDGTIGYELVPGEPQSVLEPASEPACVHTRTEPKLYICNSSDQVAISQDQVRAQRAANTALPSDEWDIVLGDGYAERLSKNIQALSIQSNDSRTLIRAVLRQK